jgi:hypothetical protein
MRPANLGIINTGSIGGDARVELDLRRIGDEIRIDAQDSVVNVKGRMRQVRKHAGGGNAFTPHVRAELDAVLAELGARLDGVSARMPAETNRVLTALEGLSRELGKPKPSPGLLEQTWSGVKKALGLLADLPEVVSLGKKLATLVAIVL